MIFGLFFINIFSLAYRVKLLLNVGKANVKSKTIKVETNEN